MWKRRKRAGDGRRGIRVWLGLLACAGLAAAAAAEEGEPVRDAATNPVALDALLKLPDRPVSAPATVPQVGGATRKEWVERFERARGRVDAAETRLADAQGELEKLASGSESWQVSAPGVQTATAETGPLSFGLRQEIRRSREELEEAQQALSELRVEANLAGVPEDWRREPGAE